MSQPRQFHHHHPHHMIGGGGGGGGGGGQFNDTTFTKIFVGGLAWETQRETMRKYFEQFGDILEAVVITDKASGRSKGYGFVTFKDAESAAKACQNPAPIIDGRKANCNLASLGAQKNRPPPQPAHHQVLGLLNEYGWSKNKTVGGPGWFRAGAAAAGMVAPPPFPPSTYFQLQQSAQLPFPHSPYGYTGFSHDTTMYPMSYYGVYGGQQYSPYYTSGGGGGGGVEQQQAGYIQNMYPYYSPYAAAQTSQVQHQHQNQHQQAHGGYGVHYNHPSAGQLLQYSYFPQQQQQNFPSSSGILSLPVPTLTLPASVTSSALAPTGGTQSSAVPVQVHPPQVASGSVSENNSSST